MCGIALLLEETRRAEQDGVSESTIQKISSAVFECVKLASDGDDDVGIRDDVDAREDIGVEVGPTDIEALGEAIAFRGPSGQFCRDVDGLAGGAMIARMRASVLAVQGELTESGNDVVVTPQPVVGRDGKDFLLFNGEVFSSTELELSLPIRNDGEALAEKMGKCVSDQDIASLLETIEGPWALIYLSAERLYFARSFFGQRSLLVRCGANSLALSSVVAPVFSDYGKREADAWLEVPPHVLFGVDLSAAGSSNPDPRSPIVTPTKLDYPMLANRVRKEEVTGRQECAEVVLRALEDSVRLRVRALPPPFPGQDDPSELPARLGILFSGGIDSAMLAALVERSRCIADSEPIDLINVAFVRQSAVGQVGPAPKQPTQQVVQYPDRKTGIEALMILKRVFPKRNWRMICVNVSEGEVAEHQTEIFASIFPQCTVMHMTIGAALWFGSRASGKILCDSCSGSDDAVMQSLAPAMGNECGCTGRYTSRARVLLLGAGADEQLAGYGRHRTAFKRGGEATLNSELEKDLSRIWQRNMGRDDRAISCHGREARFPFLGDSFVSCIQSLPLSSVCDLSEEAGVGDKRVLRDIAANIGLETISGFPKRAIQFGSRSGKMFFPSTSKVKGDDTWTPSGSS